jgi:uncharacterized SAM-binding protein YcdF (DUF218 family)
MTMPLVLVLALVAALFAWRKRRRLALAFGVAVAAIFLAGGYGLLARPLLTLQDGFDTEVRAWGNHNAIVLLGAGSALPDRGTLEPGIFGYGRLLKALEIYHACKTHSSDCKIIASGGDPKGFGTTEAQVFGALLGNVGVPSEDVILENRSLNTWQNAQFSARFFANHRFDRAYLVRSGVHLPRAMLYFAHFGIVTTPVRADYGQPVLAALPLSYNFILTDVAIHEHLGIWRYYVYNALGWNVSPTQPGAL